MKSFKQLKSIIKKQMTPKDFFMSEIFRHHFSSLVKMVSRRYGNEEMRVKTAWGGKEVAYTDNRTVFVNLNNEIVEDVKDIEQRFLCALGFLGHELGHVLYTDFDGFDAYASGNYGNYLGLSDEEKKIIDKIKEYRNKGFNQSLSELYHNIENIIEDGFVNRKISEAFPGTFKKGLKECHKLQFKSMPVADNPLTNAINTLLCLALDKPVPQDLQNSIDCYEELRSAIKDINTVETTDERIIITNKAIVALWHYIEPLLMLSALMQQTDGSDNSGDDQDGQNPNQSGNGSSNGGSGSSSSGGSGMSKGSEYSEENVQQGNSNLSNAVNQSKQSSKVGKGKGVLNSQNKNNKTSQSSSADKKGQDKDEQSTGSQNNKSNKSNKAESQDKDASSTQNDKEVNKSENSKGNSEGEQGNDKNNDKQGDKKDKESNKGDGNENNNAESDNNTDTRYEELSEISSDVTFNGEGSEDIKDIKTALEGLISQYARQYIKNNPEEVEKLSLESNALEITENKSSAHQGYPFVIENVKGNDTYRYNQVEQNLSGISRRLQKRVKQVLEDQLEGGVCKNLLKGNKINPASSASNNGKIFKRNILPESKDIAISVLIDESGSMAGTRIEKALEMAIVIESFCRELNIPLSIVGHSDSYKVRINNYIRFEDESSNRKYNLANMRAGGCNRDGFALSYCIKNLLERNEENKLMIIISDGRPNSSNYSGKAAEEDLANIKKTFEKKGGRLIATAIGEDKDTIKRIYGNSFLDITDINNLPIKMASIISKYVQN